jgi:hypothetical protein
MATEVRFAGGSFTAGEVSGSTRVWRFKDPAATSTLTEIGRDDWSVYLRDPRQNVGVQLDLFQKKVYLDYDGPSRRPILDIIGAK